MARDIGYLFCRLHGAPEIAAVERRKTFPCQSLRQRLGLDNSLLGQLTIEVPLTNPANIPFGLAMSNNNHLRALHGWLVARYEQKSQLWFEAFALHFHGRAQKGDANSRGLFGSGGIDNDEGNERFTLARNS